MPATMTMELWRLDAADYPAEKAISNKLDFLLNYAQLAPSTRNSQPWQFAVQDNEVHIYPDLDHWLKVADPERRELYISLGCALENLLIAAEHFQLGYQASFFSSRDDQEHFASVTFSENVATTNLRNPNLFSAIQQRCTNRELFQSRLIPKEELLQIKAAWLEKELQLHFIANIDQKRQLADMMQTAEQTLCANPAYRHELADTIGPGASGSRWPGLAQLLFRHLNLGTYLGKHDARCLMSAPVLIVLSTEKDDAVSQIKVGQLYERIALTATRLGLSTQPLSQILEIPSLRQQLAAMLPDATLLPQHFLRLGYPSGTKITHTLRREISKM